MRYDAVLFDLDGTLTKSELGITNSVKYALDKMGVPPVSDEVLKSFIGPPLYETFLKIDGIDEEGAHQAVNFYRERFSVIGWKENQVYEGIPRLLKSLKAAGAYVALATAKPRDFVVLILDHFGLAPFFDRVEAITLDDHHADKEVLVRRALPEKFLRACMVGDRKYDVEGGLRNGIDAVGVLYGYGSREELKEAGATYVAEDVSDLAAYLLDQAPLADGRFITFEGSDGCGKTTQLQNAAEWLKTMGYEVVITREPGGCPISEKIREILLDVRSEGMTPICEALLYAAARAQHVHSVIQPALRRGAVVLCDRYLDSSMVYQGAGRNLGMDLVRQINQPAIDLCLPDMTLFFEIDPDKAMARRGAATELDRIEREKGDFVRRVYDAYLSLAEAEPERIRRINADLSIEAVGDQVRSLLTELMSRR